MYAYWRVYNLTHFIGNVEARKPQKNKKNIHTQFNIIIMRIKAKAKAIAHSK